MKRSFILTIGIVAFVAFIAFKIGVSRGQQAYHSARRSQVTNGLNALQKIRAGNTNDSIDLIRNHVFSGAMILAENPTGDNKKLLAIYLSEIKNLLNESEKLPGHPTVVEIRLKKALENH